MGGSETAAVEQPAGESGDYEYYGQPGVYGNLLSPSTENIPGGRYGAVGWTDADGNLWLFGGYGEDSTSNEGYLNDVWEYNPANGTWAWMGGSATMPGPYNQGQPGIYGDLHGAASGNIPGGRTGASGWTDSSGNLWLFGGTGFASAGSLGGLDDLWEFDPANDTWAWMGGSNTTDVPTSYGNLGSPGDGNTPGAGSPGATWTDASGNFWLFSGGNSLNDLWELDPSTLEWTWMGGSTTAPEGGLTGVYGTLGVPAPQNIAGPRNGAVAWTDSTGNFWIFGGQTTVSVENNDTFLLNDLSRVGTSLLYAPTMAISPASSVIPANQSLQVTVTVSGVPLAGVPAPWYGNVEQRKL